MYKNNTYFCNRIGHASSQHVDNKEALCFLVLENLGNFQAKVKQGVV